MKCSARKVSLPSAEKHKKLAEPLAPQVPSTRLWPQLLARKGPSGPQNEIWVPVPCEAQDNIHLSSSHTKSVQNNLKISSHGITESALLGISWPKKHSGRAGRVRQFPSFQMPGHHQLPLALPAFTQVSPLPPSSGFQLPAGSVGWPQSHLHPGSSGVLSGWSFSTQCIAGNDSGRRPAGQCRDRWKGQLAGLHPRGRKTGPLRHQPWSTPHLGFMLSEAESASEHFS